MDRADVDGKVERDEGAEFHFEEMTPIVHLKAVNVMSEGLDFLEVTENNQTGFAPRSTGAGVEQEMVGGGGVGARQDVLGQEEDVMEDELFDAEEEFK